MKIFYKVSLMSVFVFLAAVGFIKPVTVLALGPAPVNLGTSANFAILGETAITDANPVVSSITGNVGVSSAAGSSITGISCTEVAGNIYDVDGTYTGGHDSITTCLMPGPGANKTLVDNAVLHMGTAYTNASAPATPAGVGPNLNIGGGTVSTQTLAPGVYTWGSNVTITGDLTLSGTASDVWIFQITGTLDIDANKSILLSGGAQASNVFWQVSGATTLKPGSVFEGTILDQTSIAMQAGAVLHGRALAQTAVTLIGNTISLPIVVTPTKLTVTKTVIGGTKVVSDFPLFIDASSVTSGILNTVSTGLHTVSETPNGNYTAVIGGDCAPNGTITLALGDVQICTITNTYVTPSSGGGSYTPSVPPLISVVKTPSPLALPGGPGLVTYTYTLHNIGKVRAENITMIDDSCNPLTLVSGDTNLDSKLDLDETWTYTCKANLTKTTTNTVVATGYANSISVTDTANATVVVGASVVPPLIHVTKVPNPLTLVGPGMVTYTEKVTNPGTVAISNVTLTDDKCSSVAYASGDTNNDSKLDTNETWTYTCTTNLIKTTTNTATVSGSANGIIATDFAIATVVVSVPGLPKTGFTPTSWNEIILIGVLMLTSISLIAFLKKRKA